MTGLLDYIFYNIDERNLERSRIVDYIRYLDELIEGGLPMYKELDYQAIKLTLIKRLSELNQEQIKYYLKNNPPKLA